MNVKLKARYHQIYGDAERQRPWLFRPFANQRLFMDKLIHNICFYALPGSKNTV